MTRKCPSCDGENVTRTLYAGFPMWFCTDECACLWGFWSFLLTLELLPFNGWFYHYDGMYLVALWNWLRQDPC